MAVLLPFLGSFLQPHGHLSLSSTQVVVTLSIWAEIKEFKKPEHLPVPTQTDRHVLSHYTPDGSSNILGHIRARGEASSWQFTT